MASISSGLRTTFLLFAIFALLLGLAYLLVPQAFGDLVGWPPAQPFDQRVIGTLFLAFALAAWLASRATEWAAVKLFVQMELFWTILAALLMAWGLLSLPMPALGWVYVVLLLAFAAAFGSFYRRHAAG